MTERVSAAPQLQSILDALAAMKARDGEAAMLPRECYTAPEFFEFERAAVFARS